MDQGKDKKKNIVTVVLNGELTISRARELKEIFVAQLLAGKALHLDLSGASAIDVSGLQLLCSLHRTAQSRNSEVRITSRVPDQIMQTVQTAGLVGSQNSKPNCGCACLWDLGEPV